MLTRRDWYDTTDGYELFRRAIVERDEQAWAEGAARYRAMLITWAGRCSSSATIQERCDDIADMAFARAWAALTPERFASIPSLAALLAYLRTCVSTAIIDYARNALLHERLSQAVESEEIVSIEDVVLDRLDRQALWRIALSEAHTEQERLVLVENCMYSLRPATIFARHPQQFSSITQIYTAKRNLIERLKRNPELQRLYEDW